MKKRTGKMISLSLAVAMAMTAAPVTALAVDEPVLTTAQNAGETGTDTTTVDTKEEVGLTQLEPAITLEETPENEAKAGEIDSIEALEQAIDNAKGNNETITITQSFNIDKTITVDKAVTIKAADGVKLTVTGSKNTFKLSNGATLDGLEIEKTDDTNADIVYIVSDATVKNCKFSGTYDNTTNNNQTTRATLTEAGATNFVIENNEIRNLRQPGYIEGDGQIIGNTVENTRGWVVCSNYAPTFEGNTFSSNALDIAIIDNDGAPSIFDDSIAKLSEANNDAYVEHQVDKASAKDGVFYVDETQQNGYATMSGALKNAGTTESTIVLKNNVIGDFTIAENQNITLDLNGYTITNTSNHTIINNGTLTIKDSSEGKTGTIDNVTHARAAVWNDGIAILEGGTYTRSLENGIDEGNSGGNSYYNIVNHNRMTIESGVTVEQDGNFSSMIENGWYDGNENTEQTPSIMIIEGGTFSGGLNTVKNDDYGELTINDGDFSNISQAAFLNWNTATINGGNFEVNDNADAVILNGYGNATMDKGELTINGGNFNTKQNDVNFIETMYKKSGYTSGTIEVNGGNIYGDILLSDVTEGATLSISNGVTINGNITNGGVANVDVNGATINGKVSNTGNGSMAVTESKVDSFDETNNIIFINSSKTDGTPIPDSDISNAVAMIGATTYDTFDAAIAAAKSGQTIRLMKNVEVNHAVTIPAGVTLDGGKNTTITLTAELANGAFITAGGDNVTIQNITIDTNENAKHGVQFYCVKGGEMDNVAVNGGYYTSVIVNGAEATIKNSTLNLDEGKGYANIEFAVGDGVTTVPKVTIENVTTTPDKPVVYMDNTTFTRIKDLEDMSEITREKLNANNVTGAFLYYNDGTGDEDATLPEITFDPTGGSIANPTQKINISGHLDSLPTASRSGYRLDGWYTKAEGGDKITTDTLFTENTTVYAQWSKKSSGGSSHSYDGYITIINPKNGEVSVSDDWAYEDDKITLTITPDDGYEVDKIEIVDDEGDKIDAKKVDDEDNKYTFRMANCDVTVTVTFKEEGKTTEDTDKEEDKDDEETTELNFTDVKESDWFYKGVAYVVDKGVMSGVSENQFDPSGKLTRAMLVQMLYNMESRPACDAENAFIDVPVGQWYTDAVIWANDEKIVSGMGDGLFAPNMEITREQMVVMLYNYAKYKGYDVTASTDLSKFADNASVSTWAQPAMQWAVAEGYISGMGDNQLAPQGTATRAEIASVIMRFMEATAESAETAE